MIESFPTSKIHETAIVDHDCVIGEGSIIRQYTSITRGTVLGKNCSVSPFTALDGPVFGDDCKIMHNVTMGPGFKFGDRCFVGPGVVLCNDAWPSVDTSGFRTDVFDGEDWAVICEDGVAIGANATILPGVRIGAGAMIGAGAVVTKDVPEYHLWTNTGELRPISNMAKPIRMRTITDD